MVFTVKFLFSFSVTDRSQFNKTHASYCKNMLSLRQTFITLTKEVIGLHCARVVQE